MHLVKLLVKCVGLTEHRMQKVRPKVIARVSWAPFSNQTHAFHVPLESICPEAAKQNAPPVAILTAPQGRLASTYLGRRPFLPFVNASRDTN